MKDTVERLLAVEAKAEQIVTDARVACDQIVADARNQARAERQRFEKGLPELRQSYLDQARTRADEACRERARQHEQRHREMKSLAETNRSAAVAAALDLLLDPESD